MQFLLTQSFILMSQSTVRLKLTIKNQLPIAIVVSITACGRRCYSFYFCEGILKNK